MIASYKLDFQVRIFNGPHPLELAFSLHHQIKADTEAL